MRLTTEDTAARLLRSVKGDVTNLKSSQDIDETPIQIRSVADSERSSDATEQSTDTDPGWEWGSSSWGYATWN